MLLQHSSGSPPVGSVLYAYGILTAMDVVSLTRQLVDIESITGNEGPVGEFLHGELLASGLSILSRWRSRDGA